MSKRRYMWYGHASSEGGPLLIADVDAWASWGGADEVWGDDAVYRVHSYGPIIARLPERFQQKPGEWHQYACVKGREASQAYVRELRAAAEAVEPSLAMRVQKQMSLAELMSKAKAALAAQGASFVPPLGEGADAAAATNDWLSSWRDHIEGGADFYAGEERMLHVDAKPDTDYARACEALEGDAVIVRFGEDNARTGLVWDLGGPGTARVALARDGFLLMRSWLDDERKKERDARDRAVNATDEADAGTIAFPTGRVAIVWAPVAPADVAESTDLRAALRAAADLHPPVQLNQQGMLGIGTLVRVAPGEYRVACGAHEDEDWSCRWARFTRMD